MAYSDVKSFDYEQHVVNIDSKNYIDGHRIKTGNELVTPILPITQKILERNNYKMEITSNQKYNQFLKGIEIAIGCSFPLTTHTRRHRTYSYILKIKSLQDLFFRQVTV